MNLKFFSIIASAFLSIFEQVLCLRCYSCINCPTETFPTQQCGFKYAFCVREEFQLRDPLDSYAMTTSIVNRYCAMTCQQNTDPESIYQTQCCAYDNCNKSNRNYFQLFTILFFTSISSTLYFCQ